MPEATDHLDEHQTRLQKLQQLKDADIIPYAPKYTRTHTIAQLRKLAEGLQLTDAEPFMTEGAKNTYSIAGRMLMFRTHGKLSFAQIADQDGQIQVAFVNGLCQLHTGKQLVKEVTIADQQLSVYKFVEKYLDVGDFIGVEGELFMTKHGELTLFVHTVQLLSKAVKPLGDKRHGIGEDQERTYRQRYLDMIFNEESSNRMKLRSSFIKTLREFYRSHEFIELDTPILGNSASGAAARPFVTHHEDFDLNMYLRIAPEIALKIATVGGLERVFEIGKDFRNEGSSPSHHQEFLVAEHYAVYRNYEDNMRFTEQMFDYLFEHIPTLSRKVQVADKEGVEREVDFSTPRLRIDYIEQIKSDAGIDVSEFGPEDEKKLREVIKKHGFQREGLEKQTTATMIDYLYKKVTRPKIVGPAFIYNYPKTMQPLARQSDTNKYLVEQFQVVVNGWEIVKAYSELVDPVIQQENFDEQAGAVAAGDTEATKADDEFITAMQHGMPPQSGRGMGIDRVLTMLTEQKNVRDVIMFPMMKPELSSAPIASTPSPTTQDAPAPKLDLSHIPEKAALQLIEEYLTDTKRHCLQVGHVMRCFAKELGQDEHHRRLAGALHDVDRDHIAKDPDKHLKAEFEVIMDKIDAPAALRDDIKSHGERLTGVPVNSMIRKYLSSVDELSGFLHAYSLMRPTRFEGMEVKGVMKRLKDKTFAAGVDRAHVTNCETYLGIPFAEFCEKVIGYMSSYQDE